MGSDAVGFMAFGGFARPGDVLRPANSSSVAGPRQRGSLCAEAIGAAVKDLRHGEFDTSKLCRRARGSMCAPLVSSARWPQAGNRVRRMADRRRFGAAPPIPGGGGACPDVSDE